MWDPVCPKLIWRHCAFLKMRCFPGLPAKQWSSCRASRPLKIMCGLNTSAGDSLEPITGAPFGSGIGSEALVFPRLGRTIQLLMRWKVSHNPVSILAVGLFGQLKCALVPQVTEFSFLLFYLSAWKRERRNWSWVVENPEQKGCIGFLPSPRHIWPQLRLVSIVLSSGRCMHVTNLETRR